MKENKFSGILPSNESDKPKEIIAKDKKLLTIVMIVMLIITTVIMLVSFIVGIVAGIAEAAILAILAAALSVLQILVLISVAHNISRQTAVLICLAEKLLGENPLPNAKDKTVNLSEKVNTKTKAE